LGEAVVHIKVVLHSIYREKLPPEAKGQATIELPSGRTVADALAHLDIPMEAVCAVNGQVERERARPLHEGDQIEVFVRMGGG
jgi:sulfur carrier protein ThiS